MKIKINGSALLIFSVHGRILYRKLLILIKKFNYASKVWLKEIYELEMQNDFTIERGGNFYWKSGSV